MFCNRMLQIASQCWTQKIKQALLQKLKSKNNQGFHAAYLHNSIMPLLSKDVLLTQSDLKHNLSASAILLYWEQK